MANRTYKRVSRESLCDEKTQGNSPDLDMVVLTRKQLPVFLKLDVNSSFFACVVQAQMTVTRPNLSASFEVNLCAF